MRSCKEVSKLISESLDRKLPLGERVSIRIHLLYCKFCSRFKDQISLMRAAAGRLRGEKNVGGSISSLSPEARERIKHSLKPKDM